MNTGEVIKRIGRTFEVHESLGKRYFKCDRCENQYEGVVQAASCCAEPGETKRVRKLEQNEKYWAKKRKQIKTTKAPTTKARQKNVPPKPKAESVPPSNANATSNPLQKTLDEIRAIIDLLSAAEQAIRRISDWMGAL